MHSNLVVMASTSLVSGFKIAKIYTDKDQSQNLSFFQSVLWKKDTSAEFAAPGETEESTLWRKNEQDERQKKAPEERGASACDSRKQEGDESG